MKVLLSSMIAVAEFLIDLDPRNSPFHNEFYRHSWVLSSSKGSDLQICSSQSSPPRYHVKHKFRFGQCLLSRSGGLLEGPSSSECSSWVASHPSCPLSFHCRRWSCRRGGSSSPPSRWGGWQLCAPCWCWFWFPRCCLKASLLRPCASAKSAAKIEWSLPSRTCCSLPLIRTDS